MLDSLKRWTSLITFAIAGCSGGGGTLSPTPSLGAGELTSVQGMNVSSVRETAAMPAAKSEMPRSADAFVDSVGINVHLHYTNTPYATAYPAVRSLLSELYVRHLRDGLIDTTWQSYYDRIKDLRSLGMHFDLIAAMGVSASVIQSYPARIPNAIESFEGPNEYNLSGNPNWAAQLAAFQKTLYSAVKGSSLTSQYPVLAPSLTSLEAGASLGNLSSSLDSGNMHDYFNHFNPGTSGWGGYFPGFGAYGSIPFDISVAGQTSKPKPMTSTESGYTDQSGNSQAVSASVKARYEMRLLLEHWNANVTRTFLYELVDEGNENFGLVDASLRPKPAYSALHNLLYKLQDPGGPISLKALTYAMSADPSVHHALLQKRDGSYRLMLWVERMASDPTVPTQTVTLNSAVRFRTVTQYAWNDSGNVDTTALVQGSDGTVKLQVTDRVTELKLQQ